MLKEFLTAYKGYKEFKAIAPEKHPLVFYAESSGDWPHLGPVVEKLSSDHNQELYYLTSDFNDPILSTTNTNIKSFYIGSGMFRTIIFYSIEARLIVMTLPDLETYYLKRSINPSHYLYIFHSINSTHMVYRKGAFDNFDTVFCVGPHHVKEIRETEKIYNLKEKKLIEHGYGRLDSIIEMNSKRKDYEPSKGPSKKVLLAPSWGPNSITNTCAEKVIELLLNAGHQVVFRPHSMSVRLSNSILNGINRKFKNNSLYKYETNLSSQDSLHESDVMISDFSGAATEFAFGLEKPVVFIDLPKKVNNSEYRKISSEPLENSIRCEIGSIVKPDDLGALPSKVCNVCDHYDVSHQKILAAREASVYNIASSGTVGANVIIDILNQELSK